MGTSVSLSWRGAELTHDDLMRVEAEFATFDARYSLYRDDTELSRIASGALALVDSSEDLRTTYALALDWRDRTSGAFSPHRPDGTIDLSGVVKALAMDAAAGIVRSRGCRDWCLNVGGDILVAGDAGGAGDGAAWVIGIVDPDDRNALLTSVSLVGARLACATSGSAERGDHIWALGAPKPEFVQVSVIAADIVTADVLATAIVAGGAASLDAATRIWPIDVMTVDVGGQIRMSPGFAEAMSESRSRAAAAAN